MQMGEFFLQGGSFVWNKCVSLGRIETRVMTGRYVNKRLFETAEIARFSESEIRDYEDSLKNLRDLGNVLDTAKEEGRKEGIEEGEKRKSMEMALRMRDDGMPLEVIAKYTGLSVEEIRNLKL